VLHDETATLDVSHDAAPSVVPLNRQQQWAVQFLLWQSYVFKLANERKTLSYGSKTSAVSAEPLDFNRIASRHGETHLNVQIGVFVCSRLSAEAALKSFCCHMMDRMPRKAASERTLLSAQVRILTRSVPAGAPGYGPTHGRAGLKISTCSDDLWNPSCHSQFGAASMPQMLWAKHRHRGPGGNDSGAPCHELGPMSVDVERQMQRCRQAIRPY
jgi:hypothetical protein